MTGTRSGVLSELSQTRQGRSWKEPASLRATDRVQQEQRCRMVSTGSVSLRAVAQSQTPDALSTQDVTTPAKTRLWR
jgi:hypothetical protein